MFFHTELSFITVFILLQPEWNIQLSSSSGFRHHNSNWKRRVRRQCCAASCCSQSSLFAFKDMKEALWHGCWYTCKRLWVEFKARDKWRRRRRQSARRRTARTQWLTFALILSKQNREGVNSWKQHNKTPNDTVNKYFPKVKMSQTAALWAQSQQKTVFKVFDANKRLIFITSGRVLWRPDGFCSEVHENRECESCFN